MADEIQPDSSKEETNISKLKMEGTGIKISFSLRNEVVKLAEAIEKLLSRQVNLDQISYEPKGDSSEEFDFFVTCGNTGRLQEALDDLYKSFENFKIISIPDFHTCAKDLHKVKPKTIRRKEGLENIPSCFTDEEYQKRKSEVIGKSGNYIYGEKIPEVEYTDQEIEIWGYVYTELKELHKQHACERFNRNFERLKNECGYSSDKIPQLEDVSKFLHSCTGFRLIPAPGFISQKDFLAALAFRTFYATQYIRHHSKKKCTPEPDVCHELLGHVPLLADEEFAQFVQHIGLASLGAPPEQIKKLFRLQWFTVEVGLWKEGKDTKVYGAALLSSCEELEHCLKDETKRSTFDPEKACETTPEPSKNQHCYFVANSFESLKEQMSTFAKTNPRPFDVSYVKSTESVEVIRVIPKH